MEKVVQHFHLVRLPERPPSSSVSRRATLGDWDDLAPAWQTRQAVRPSRRGGGEVGRWGGVPGLGFWTLDSRRLAEDAAASVCCLRTRRISGQPANSLISGGQVIDRHRPDIASESQWDNTAAGKFQPSSFSTAFSAIFLPVAIVNDGGLLDWAPI